MRGNANTSFSCLKNMGGIPSGPQVKLLLSFLIALRFVNKRTSAQQNYHFLQLRSKKQGKCTESIYQLNTLFGLMTKCEKLVKKMDYMKVIPKIILTSKVISQPNGEC